MLIKRILNYLYIRFFAFVNFILNTKKVNEDWVNISALKDEPSIKTVDIPKIIWMYWDSNSSNEIVELCFKNTKDICSDYEVILMSKNNILDYVDISCLKSDLKPQIIADYIRLSLLSKYGGIWMDASILLVENLDWIFKKILNDSVFVFYSDECTIDRKRPIIENWFIVAPKNNIFINDWLEEFKSCALSIDPYSYYKNYEGNIEFIQKIGNTNYLMCYISAAIVMKKKSYNIVTLNSGSTGHYYNYKFKFQSIFIALTLCVRNYHKIYSPKLIKFTQDSRGMINLFMKKGWVRKDSLMYLIQKNKFFE